MKRDPSPRRAGVRCAPTKQLLTILVAFGALVSPSMPFRAGTRVWTGAASSLWSNPNNWNPAGAPVDGDNLLFNTGGSSMNDRTNLRIRRLDFEDPNGEQHDYQLSGNTLTIMVGDADHNGQDGIFCISTEGGVVTINLDLILEARARVESNTKTLRINGAINLGTNVMALSSSGNPDSTAGDVEISGTISGAGGVSASTSGGTIRFTGTSDNTFTGIFFVQLTSEDYPVILAKSPGHLAVPGELLLSTDGVVKLGASEQIANNAVIALSHGGRLLLNGFFESVGTLAFNTSTALDPSLVDSGSGQLAVTDHIQIQPDTNPAHIKGRLNVIGVRPINLALGGALEVDGNIVGDGFETTGAGTLRLRGANTFTGDALLTGGTIEAYSPQALGQAAPGHGVHLNGASLILESVAIGSEPLIVDSASSLFTAINQCSWAGPVTLNTDFNVVAVDATFSNLKMNFSGSISGGGGLNLMPAILGSGNVQLSGSAGNTFTGTTTVNCQLLELNKPPGVNAFAGPLIVGGSSGSALHEARWLRSYQNIGATATLYANGVINLNNHNEDFGPVTFNGGEVDTGTGQFAIYAPLTVNPAATSAVINGYLGLPPGADRNFVVGDGASDCDLLVNAVVFGSPGTYFVKQGAGTMCLATANTYDAPTLLEAGILDINGDAGLGTWPGLVIFNGATLRISGPGNTGGGMEVLGAGVGGTHGAIEVSPGNSFSISGGVLLDSSTTLNMGSSATLGLNGLVTGNGPLIKTGAGALVFGGGANNTYSGDTVVSSGSLLMARSANKISVPGNLIIGPGPASPTTFARLYQAGGLGGTTVTVNANSLFDLFGNYQSLTTLNLRDGGSVQTGAGLLDFPNGGAINVGSVNALIGSHVSASITGAIGLPANATLNFNINSYAPFPPFASGPELDVLATIPRPVEDLGFAPAGITKNGSGQMRLSANNTYAGSTLINGGTLLVDGTQPQSLVAVNSGTLGGSGTVGDIYMTGSAAVVAPGDNGPGILTCGNVNAGINASGVLRMELNGTTPGSGYDQLNVRGTVNLAGVALQRLLGFSPPTGAQFDIISNDGRDLVTGAFNGLPGGGKLYIGGVIYQINYRFGGRFGNDVALQGLDTPLPPPPTLTIQRLPPASVRLLWPVSDPPFDLQTCTNLTAASWTNALPLPVVNGTNNLVTNPALSAQQFYRLISP